MSVNIATNTQPATWLQRLTGSEPRTVVKETSTTTITSQPGGSFSLKSALRNGGIGAALAGVLGGVSLLGKVALPVIGKVATLGGLAKLAGVGGAIGLATAALPILAPRIQQSPTAKAALLGAGIGAAAGAALPLVPIWLGASIGAGVGLLVHNKKHRSHDYPMYPGYQAYPGFQPYGMNAGAHMPQGLVPVTPNYGSYAGTAMNPYGNMSGYGMVQGGYGNAMPAAYGYGNANGYGNGYGDAQSMMLPAQASAPAAANAAMPGAAQQTNSAVATPVATAAPRAAKNELPPVGVKKSSKKSSSKKSTGAKTTKAKSFKDSKGNIRQIGTGKILKPSTATLAAQHAAGLQAASTPNVQGGFSTGYGLDMGAQPTGLGDSMLASLGMVNPNLAAGMAYGAAPQPNAAAGAQLANGTTPLPDATQMVAGIQPTVLPQLPGM
ncbi:MAG: hypothetical protein ABI200_04060 [Gaiellales bacterium]